MNKSKMECSAKKLKIYQLPLVTRIAMLFSAACLTAVTVVALFMGFLKIWQSIAILIVMLGYSTYIYFLVFKMYICLDFGKNKLIIREFPGCKRKEIDIFYIKEIRFSDGMPERNKKWFTIDIVCRGFTERIASWSGYSFGGRLVMFNVYNRQKRRLLKFIKECDEVLKPDGHQS